MASVRARGDRSSRATLARRGDVTLPVALAEDLVIYKAIAGRPRDRADLDHLLRRHGHEIDRVRVRAIVGEFASALEDDGPVELLESVFAEANED